VRLLVLGGTKFLGRAAVESALARGHEVTLFNRGETNPALFPEAEKLHGDRTDPGSRRLLEGREWDAVLDPSGYIPSVVRASAEALADATGHYLFVSSVSVYASLAEPVDEMFRCGDYLVQKRCPHLRADLERFGSVTDGVLECKVHHWRFELATGRCLTSDDDEHRLRTERISD